MMKKFRERNMDTEGVKLDNQPTGMVLMGESNPVCITSTNKALLVNVSALKYNF